MSKKLLQRIQTGLTHTVYALFNSFFNFLVSIIIIRGHSAELWGGFVQYLIVLTFLSLLIDWGQKEYLVKTLSQGSNFSLWQTSTTSRSILLVAVAPFLIFIFGPTTGTFLTLWAAAHTFHHSFDSIIVFERKFVFPLTLDLSGFAILASLILLLKVGLTVDMLIIIFAGLSFLKGLCLFLYFKKKLLAHTGPKFNINYLIGSFPFFLPSLVGFFQAKIDTFTVAYYLPKEELGKYYLFINLLSYCHLSALMLFTPYIKNLYRLKNESINKIAFSAFALGTGWSILGLAGIFIITKWVYKFDFYPIHFLIAYFVLLPYFYYFIRMYQLYGSNRPYQVVMITLISAVFNFILCIVLIPTYHITGALIANGASQWLNAFLFEYSARYKIKVLKNP